MRLLKSRIHHWNCSKFANWIRGEDKPYALEWAEWDKWEIQEKKKRPIRYWLSDTFLKKLQDIVYFPLDLYRTIQVYIRNRYIDKLQYLDTGLKPGEYYDLDYRIINALFNELVDFVEIELAHLSLSDRKKKYKFHNGKCIEAAYDYFNWVCNLKYDDTYGYKQNEPMYGHLTEQAKNYRKIKKLYEWWKNERPNRKSPYDNPLLGDIADICDNKKYKNKKKLYKQAYQKQVDQENEDTKMLIELIRVRKHLWT